MRLILATTPTGGIGYRGKLPWKKLQGDLPRFNKLTTNETVVMGRKTYESLPIRPLPNRHNVVITSNSIETVNTINNINDIPENSWIIGGANLIAQCWDKINTVHLSMSYEYYDCDTYVDLTYLHDNFAKIHSTKHLDHEYSIWQRDIRKNI